MKKVLGKLVRLKSNVNHECPEGRDNHPIAKVKTELTNIGPGAYLLDRDLCGCQYWNNDSLEFLPGADAVEHMYSKLEGNMVPITDFVNRQLVWSAVAPSELFMESFEELEKSLWELADSAAQRESKRSAEEYLKVARVSTRDSEALKKALCGIAEREAARLIVGWPLPEQNHTQRVNVVRM